LTDLRPEHFRKLYAELRKQTSQNTGKPLSEYTVEGVHACLCGILSDAMEGGFINHNPAWRTYKYSGKKKEKLVADEETVQKIITALENESIKYETYYKLIIATGMRRGECCGLKWSDIDYQKHSIHIQRSPSHASNFGATSLTTSPKTHLPSSAHLLQLIQPRMALPPIWMVSVSMPSAVKIFSISRSAIEVLPLGRGLPLIIRTFIFRLLFKN